MRAVVITARTRPHTTDAQECWCKPVAYECECSGDCPVVYVHRAVDLDDIGTRQYKMASFSEQRQYDRSC